MRGQIWLYAAVMCAAAPAWASAEPTLASRIDRLTTRNFQQSKVVGLSVAVARDGRLLFAKGYGSGNRNHAPATADSIYHIDSITKHITAAALLSLAEQHKLSLDDPLSKYLPDFPVAGHVVLVRQLINHTSGIKSFTDLSNWNSYESRAMSHAQILSLLRGLPLDFRPGESWRYNNSGFYLAGLVIERASHEKYGAYVQRLFRKFHMDHSSLGCPEVLGHEIKNGKVVAAAPIDWATPFSAGGLCSTAKDLVLWEDALQAGRVISARSLAVMSAPTRLHDGTVIDYGLGTRLGALAGHRVLGHTGSGGGFSTALQYFPNDRLTIAILVNTEGALRAGALAASIAREVLGLPQASMPLPKPLPVRAFARYTGIFDSDEGPIQIFREGNGLAFRIPGAKRPLGVMSYQGHDTFAIAPDIFVRGAGAGNKIEWGISYEYGLMMDAKRRVH